jgi:hypothetical protein
MKEPISGIFLFGMAPIEVYPKVPLVNMKKLSIFG